MSLFATLYATEPSTPVEALRIAFPEAVILLGTPARVTAAGVDASSWNPTEPNFHEELIGFTPAVLIYFVLDKADTHKARRALGEAVRSFLQSSRGDVVVNYLDVPVIKRDASGAWYNDSYGDFVDGPGWIGVDRVAIPRDQAEPGS